MPHLEHIIHLSYILAHHSVELGVDTYLHHTFAKISAGMDSMGVQSFYNSFLSDSPVENLSSYGGIGHMGWDRIKIYINGKLPE